MITSINLTIDRRTNDVVSATADNHVVTQDVAKDAATTALLTATSRSSDPIANQVVGTITASLTREPGGFTSPPASQEMGDVIADAQLKATKAEDFGSSVVAFMNPGGIRADLIYTRTRRGAAGT